MLSLGTFEILIILFMVFFISILTVLPFWKIFGKAGFSPWLSVLMLVPVVHIVLLYFIAFADWPVLQQMRKQT
jgi:hypothetical protein